MDNQKLADLLFPEELKTPEYYEEKFPYRKLPKGAEVTRMAPSPTGFIHLGNLYSALADERIAHRKKGVFYLRIEDTDAKRKVEGAVETIINVLRYFDIEFDEGAGFEDSAEGNAYGPYFQRQRVEIYHTYVKELVKKGLAYPCFCTEDELSKVREQQEKDKVLTGYYGKYATCRNLSYEEIEKNIKDGKPYVVRLRSQGQPDKEITFVDSIKGEIKLPENIHDIVILKQDGVPTYHFAHAVDDHLMHTTHVIRGDEWLSSVPLHLQLFQVLGFKAPKYAHIAPIMKNEDGNKRKLSKRKDPEAAVSYYAEQGIPKEAVKEYLLNIANSTFENWRRANPDKKIEEFDLQLNKMSVSGALFDMVKLLDVSKIVISKMSADDVYSSSLDWAKKQDEELANLLENQKEYSLKVFGIERGNKKPRKDISKWSDVKENISYMYDELFEKDNSEYQYQVINDKDDIRRILDLYVSKYYNFEDDKQTWFDKIKELAGEMGYAKEVKEFKANPGVYKAHVGDVSTVLRVALTKRTNTPDMYEIMQVLGKDVIESRFEIAKENLK